MPRRRRHTLDFENLKLPGVVLFHTVRYGDERGYFMERYKRSALLEGGVDETFVQSNLSFSRRGILRGIHYQAAPAGQGKLLQVLSGAIFDVVVDVTPDSPTFGEWLAVEISAENGNLLYVPPQYGHAFCTLTDDCLLLYDVTYEYAPEQERGIIWNDPSLNIPWPVSEPVVSAKDALLPTIESLRAGAAR
ncbi:MAG: dTDP-4-dehydrorhamnose 3,5-epimerase [Dehalococcoidia bacterium]